MRHKLSGRKLNRTSSHRAAMFKNLCISTIEHELIKTTLPKGKDMRRVLEPLITLAKIDSVANRRLAYARLGNDVAVKKLFEVLGPRYKTRQGGYLRVLKCGFRVGDRAPMCYVELVDREGAADAVVEVSGENAAPQVKAEKPKAKAKPKAEGAAKPKAKTAKTKTTKAKKDTE